MVPNRIFLMTSADSIDSVPSGLAPSSSVVYIGFKIYFLLTLSLEGRGGGVALHVVCFGTDLSRHPPPCIMVHLA